MQSCIICKQTHGSCIQCCKCTTYFHATCASRAGYGMEVSLGLEFVHVRHYFENETIVFLWLMKNASSILNFQVQSFEKNGQQISRKVMYCAIHRLVPWFFSPLWSSTVYVNLLKKNKVFVPLCLLELS